MQRFRVTRGRKAALALLPATALLTAGSIGIASGSSDDQARMATDKNRVKPGTKVRVTGRFPVRQASPTSAVAADEGDARGVRIQFRPAGKSNWRKAKTTTTDREGRFAERVKVRVSGRLRAVHADGRRSEVRKVRVKSRVRGKAKRRNVLRGKRVPVTGQVVPRGTKRKVVVRIGGRKLTTRTKKNGRFQVRWKANRTGVFKAKVRAKGNRAAAGSKTRGGKVKVFRRAQASWYGPGFYGNRTACGQTLTPSTVGVANKTLPCGTRLTLRYRGKSVNVRVIDRGPYHGNREFDLTRRTKEQLGFGSTGAVLSTR
jgi:rare lipoprotein A